MIVDRQIYTQTDMLVRILCFPIWGGVKIRTDLRKLMHVQMGGQPKSIMPPSDPVYRVGGSMQTKPDMTKSKQIRTKW